MFQDQLSLKLNSEYRQAEELTLLSVSCVLTCIIYSIFGGLTTLLIDAKNRARPAEIWGAVLSSIADVISERNKPKNKKRNRKKQHKKMKTTVKMGEAFKERLCERVESLQTTS